MEALNIVFGDKWFDELVHGPQVNGAATLLQASPITVACKDVATAGGRPGAVICFNVALPDGSIAHARATTTVRNLMALATALRGRYPDLME